MANDVFANNMELSCKSGAGKTICAFPDVCFTPPENPATPPGVPIPYPNTGMDSDTTEGSKTVSISGNEVMLKNKSYFKKSTGDEAGSAAKKGVLTSVNRSKVYFNAWSMDVKVEGENVVRHLDITTHNHASFPGNSPTWPFLDNQAFGGSGPCKDLAKEVNDKCADKVVKNKKGQVTTRTRAASLAKMCADDKPGGCKDAMKCVLTTKDPNNCCPEADPAGGPPVQPTPHHIVPDSQFYDASGARLLDGSNYKYGRAPCICAQGTTHTGGKHGEIHGQTNTRTRAFLGVPAGKAIPDQRWPVAAAERIGAEAVADATGCDKECLRQQVRNGNAAMGINRGDQIRPSTAGGEAEPGGPILL
jgi:hypothetical protein